MKTILPPPRWRFWFGIIFLAVIYIVIIWAKRKNALALAADEGGYFRIANELAKGTLPQVNWWGPGYPLFLALFVKLQIPMSVAKFANAGFLIGSIIYLRSSLLLYMGESNASRIALITGFYLPYFSFIHMLMSEIFAIFLMSALAYHYLAMHEENRRKLLHIISASIFMTWLALTKVLYGYVLLASICLVLSTVWKLRPHLVKTLSVLLLSFLFCLPYVWHNYKLTGKFFYWSTSGGLSLYWMSTPFPGETGSWFPFRAVREHKFALHEDHYKLYDDLSGLDPVKRDEAYKRAAITNIIQHPLKYLFNVNVNILRMLFDFPRDFRVQTWRTALVVVPNLFLLPIFFASLYAARSARQLIPFQLWSILAFAVIAFAGSSLLSAYNRMFTLLVPIICVWTAYVWTKFIRFKICIENMKPTL